MSIRILVASLAIGSLTSLAAPVQLLPQDAAAQYEAGCRRPNLFAALEKTVSAPAGIRMRSEKKSDPIWNGGESAVTTAADVHEGDLLVLTVAARGVSEKGKGEILAKLQGSDYVGVIRETIPSTKDWAWYRFVGTAKADYPAGSLRLHLYPGGARQVVEFRALSLENYGKTDKSSLPPLPPAPQFGSDPIPDAPEPPKPIVLQPLSAEEKARPRYVMLKLDDMSAKGKGVHPRYTRVADYLRGKGLKAGFGVVINSLENDNPSWCKWVSENSEDNGGNFEFWDHGWDHAMNIGGDKNVHEYRGTSIEHQREHMKKAHDLFQEKTGLVIHSFGSAGNSFDDNTATVLSEHPEVEVWMYGNAKNTGGKLVLGRPLNLEYAVGKIDFQSFLKGYQSKRTSLPYLLLQGHPNMWDDAVFAEFQKVVEQLEADGWVFTTPHEYYNKFQPGK